MVEGPRAGRRNHRGLRGKSATSVSRRDASGLRFLRERLGDRFRAGIVLHTGTRSARIDNGLWALPVAALWGGTGA